MKSKSTAGLLAIFLGGLGVHRFYLNQTGLGIFYLLFCWTFIPSIIGLVDGIIFLTTEDNKFNLKYNKPTPPQTKPAYSPTIKQDTAQQEVKQTMTTSFVQEPIVQVEELNAIQKLQFKKFIAEQSGMNINDVDNYIDTIDETEKKELIKSFKSEQKNELQRQTIQTQPTHQLTPTIKVIQENDNFPSCPKCKSNQVTFNKKGFSAGKAIVGGVLTGGIGLLAGGIGKNKILLTCLKCGHTWKRG